MGSADLLIVDHLYRYAVFWKVKRSMSQYASLFIGQRTPNELLTLMAINISKDDLLRQGLVVVVVSDFETDPEALLLHN